METSEKYNFTFVRNSQLFGEYNADEDVSPDTADPESTGDAGADALAVEANQEVF